MYKYVHFDHTHTTHHLTFTNRFREVLDANSFANLRIFLFTIHLIISTLTTFLRNLYICMNIMDITYLSVSLLLSPYTLKTDIC